MVFTRPVRYIGCVVARNGCLIWKLTTRRLLFAWRYEMDFTQLVARAAINRR